MRRMNFLLSLFALFCIDNSWGQTIKTKDGIVVGKRSDLIAACVKGAKDKLVSLKGIKIETEKYCACAIDNLIPNITSKEMEDAMKENKMAQLFSTDKNMEIILKCLEGNFEVNGDYKFKVSEDYPELQKKVGVQACINELMNDSTRDKMLTRRVVEVYCNCAIEKLLQKGYTYRDLQKIEDPSSPVFNEIAIPCIAEALKADSVPVHTNPYVAEDIIGDKLSSSVPLVDYLGKGFKIKLDVGGETRYFLFDTGASDMIIDQDLELYLLRKGLLKKEDYLETSEYTLANNEVVEAQKVRLSHISIGDYQVNNVVVAIIKNGSLLLGKSFLDKFSKWEVDKENKVLRVYK